jgi:molybdopterin-guanine dinucleotide biosynthesis protein A
MIRLENILMIGSSGSNVGKTELACALLRKFSGERRVIAIKVTAVASRDGSCPRGGQGCGVCSSLTGEYCITQEIAPESGKDTGRLLAAGADRVYWLRVMRAHLRQGIDALLETIGHEAVIICESNSLRQVVEPGLFLMVESAAGGAWKQSAQQVRGQADRIVHSDGTRFDFDLERIQLAGSRWLLTEDAAAIVLAGGRSRRMCTDKSMLPVGGRPMIEHICRQLRGTFTRVLISANDTEKFSFLGLDVIPDRIADQGPLMAVASALQASNSELHLVVSCDVPEIRLAVVRRMLDEADGADVVVPITSDGKEQPLFAVYRRSALRHIEEAIRLGGRRLSTIYDFCKVRFTELDDTKWFVNLNTMADYERYRIGIEA